MKKKPRILLTGASGSIGSEVARRLADLAEEYELTFFDQDKWSIKRKLYKYKGKAHLIYGDIRNRSEIEKACYNQQFVLHLAALLPPMAYDNPQTARDTNTKGTKNLIECLEKHSPEVFLIYTSSIAVYGDRLIDYWITTEDKLNPAPGDIYAETKIAAEDYVKGSKLDWSILRLTAIMGDHKPSRLMFHQPLSTKMEIATIEDTGRALVAAISKQEVLSHKVFNLGGGESCRVQYDEFLDLSFKAMGLGKADFPDKSFAEKNFHCGYYRDSDQLQEILHFRSDNLDDYLKKEAYKLGAIIRLFMPFLRKMIKIWLLRLSEPYKAYKTNNSDQMSKFF
jgi:nucleoside-diphosphate-sugar epimerase